MPRRTVRFRRAAGPHETTRALVVYCHPLPDSFVAAMRDRVLAGLEAGGAETRLTDLYAEDFSPEFSADEHRTHLADGVDPSISEHAEALQWCNTLVLVYPTWWSGQPAMLKGWFDRVWVSGVAWDLPPGANRLRPRLRNVTRIVAVTSHGSAKHVNAIEGEGGKRVLSRALRAMCHPFCRFTWLALYNVDRCSGDDRAEYLERVETRLAAIAR